MEGAYKVTLVIYSGLPDPVWTIHPRHESFKEMKKLLDSAIATDNIYRHENLPSKLGYKGFLVQQPDEEQAHLIVGRETVALQTLLLETMPEDVMPDALRQKVLQAINSGAVSANVPDESQVASGQETSQIPSKRDKADAKVIPHYAPELNLARWNTHPFIRASNNCYNYCNDKITNSFAQPGYASGHPIGPGITKEGVLLSCESDGLIKMDVKPTDPCPEAPAQPNCLVALFVAPGVDFHCYRLDCNPDNPEESWSQKQGQTSATNLDADHKPISDPRTAARSPFPDYQFVSFMKIFTNIIDGPLGPH